MFTADAHFKSRTSLATFTDRPIHQLAYATAINCLERILFENALFLISDEEVAFRIIT